NYFIFVGIYSITCLLNQPSSHAIAWAWIGGLSIGLAVLLKGPVGALIPVLVGLVYWVTSRFKYMMSWRAFGRLVLATLILPFVWIGYETYNRGFDFFKNFIIYQIELFSQPIAGHGQPFYYHFVVVFVGCFPASVLAIDGLFKSSLVGES